MFSTCCFSFLSHVYVNILLYFSFPLSIIFAPLSIFVASAANFYNGACIALILLFASIPAIVAMLFFVNATPYVVNATFLVFVLLVLKYIQGRVIVIE